MACRSFGLGLAVLLTALSVGACGGKSFESNGDGSDAGTGSVGGTTADGGSSAHAGSTTTGGSAAGTESGGSESAGSGGAISGGTGSGGASSGGAGVGGSPACDGFNDQSGSTVQVRLMNETQQPIYLGQLMPGCAQGPSFSVMDASGMTLQAPGFCSTTCQDVIHGTVRGCPAIACAIGSAVTLQPGEATLTQWNAAFFANRMLPAACQPPGATSTCQQIEAVKPGQFTFTAQAGTSIDCTQFGGGMCATCMPDSNGGCQTFGAVIKPPLLMAEAKVTLDASYGIGGTGGGGMTQPVEIIFK